MMKSWSEINSLINSFINYKYEAPLFFGSITTNALFSMKTILQGVCVTDYVKEKTSIFAWLKRF